MVKEREKERKEEVLKERRIKEDRKGDDKGVLDNSLRYLSELYLLSMPVKTETG